VVAATFKHVAAWSQQNHLHEREAAISEIEFSCKMLLDKLKEFKGKKLEVIQKASTFAGETVA